MPKIPPSTKFDFDVSQSCIQDCASYLDLPLDDNLTLVAAKIISATTSIHTSVDNLFQSIGTEWHQLQQTTIEALTLTVKNAGKSLDHHENISQKLTELSELYKISIAEKQQLQEALKESVQVSRQLQQDNLIMMESLQKFMLGLNNSEQTRDLQIQDLQSSIKQLKDISQKSQSNLALDLRKMETKLHGQLNQSPVSEEKIIQQISNIKTQVTDVSKQNVRLANESIQNLREKVNNIGVSLANYKFAAYTSMGVAAFILALFIWSSASHAATTSTRTANINAFGGQSYHEVALGIMDSDYRKENLNRIAQCRIKNKKIKSDILECYLKIESGVE
jgi:hypothetical protein